MGGIEYRRGGEYVGGYFEGFCFKVIVINNSQFIIKSVDVIPILYPKGFSIKMSGKKIESIKPNSSVEINIYFNVEVAATGGNLEANISYIDHLGNPHSIKTTVLAPYTANLLKPKDIKHETFTKDQELKISSNSEILENIEKIENNLLGFLDVREKEDEEFKKIKSIDTQTLLHIKKKELSDVYFSVYAPSSLIPDTSFILYIWAYLSEQKSEMEDSIEEGFEKRTEKGPIKAEIGDQFQVYLELPKPFKVEDNTDRINWYRKVTNATFAITVPKKIKSKTYLGHVKIFYDGIQLLRLDFTLKIGEQLEKLTDLTQNTKRLEKLFASYSSKDRNEVLKRVQGIRSIPGLEVFLDCLSLRQGDDWEKMIGKNILDSDLFLLFWSTSASKSKAVEKEWKFALKSHGLDFIQPVPLEPPKVTPPPKQLSSKHFNDLSLIALNN